MDHFFVSRYQPRVLMSYHSLFVKSCCLYIEHCQAGIREEEGAAVAYVDRLLELERWLCLALVLVPGIILAFIRRFNGSVPFWRIWSGQGEPTRPVILQTPPGPAGLDPRDAGNLLTAGLVGSGWAMTNEMPCFFIYRLVCVRTTARSKRILQVQNTDTPDAVIRTTYH